jgi:hypothetical protein
MWHEKAGVYRLLLQGLREVIRQVRTGFCAVSTANKLLIFDISIEELQQA